MTASAAGPGKTAAKLANDVLLFDPINCAQGENYLTDLTPPVDEGRQLSPGAKSCQHEYATKADQSITPPLDLRADSVTQYKLAVCCKKCRVHADISIDYKYALNPCPNSGNPLHHFTRRPDADVQSAERIQFGWECSSQQCRAQLRVSYRMARIQPAERIMLVDTDRLKRAYEAMQKEDPGREGLRQATPVEVLHRLRRYVTDSLNPEQARRSFPANNKRFGEAFGVWGRDCFELLDRLGFNYTEARGDEDAQWHLPNPPPLVDRFRADGSSHREALEDVEIELKALMIKAAADTNAVNPLASESWSPADRDVERTLAAQGYTRYQSARRQPPPVEQLPYFAALGIQPDSADSIVVFAHDRQSLTDPSQQSYYFECLQVIAESRRTEDLQIKVATLESEGSISRRDVAAAYRFLDISAADAKADDDRILNLFYVRISDSGTEAKEEARRALRKIGIARQSQRLVNTADEVLETVAEALDWLGNDAKVDTPDDILVVIAATKMVENAELTRKDVSVIARERSSDTLNTWLLNGRTGDYQMTIEDALRHIGITDAWASIDKRVIENVYGFARSEKPGEQTEKAIAVLEQAIKAENSRAPATTPVGLTSHGNTCYLNSLLQHYYSIKPFRDIVFNYEQYQWDADGDAVKTWRVGNMLIKPEEIRGGQRFARDLKQLFERMMRSNGDAVRPEHDLVCRAFLPITYHTLLDTTDNDQTPGTNGVPSEHAASEHATTAEASLATLSSLERPDSNASSTTLLGDTDIQMQNSDAAAAPQLPPLEGQTEPTEAPPLPPRRFSTTRQRALELAEEQAKNQQDASEVNDGVIFKLRAGLASQGHDGGKNDEQQDVIRSITDCRVVETKVKDGIDGEKEYTPDMWLTLQPPTAPTDIYSLLDQYFDLQNVGTSTETGDIEAYKSLANVPPLLQINISRVTIVDHQAIKSLHSVKLEDELYLDRYVDHSHPNVLPERRRCWAWRQQLHALRQERQALNNAPQVTNKPDNLSGPEIVSEAGLHLSEIQNTNPDLESLGVEGIEVPPNLPTALLQDTHAQMQRLVDLEGQITALELQLKDQFQEFKQLKYRLAAVFFHRGTTSGGHYWIYIKDFEKNVWRKYNDETVTEHTNVDEILEAKTYFDGTPAWAAYVQDDRKTEIMQPVCRIPDPNPKPQLDVEMQDRPSEDDGAANPRHLMAGGVAVDNTVKVEESSALWDQQRQIPQGDVW
ncbi:putative ubiquitin specific protease, UCH repeated domain-containing protein [Septoria linicola]|nr:putative ubiquitin specific protease, UCH repeated domain-containing protein [Septoria linicola]